MALKHLALMGAVVAIALMPALAWAQPSVADKATARGLMDQGDRYAAQQDFQSALRAYRGADAIMHLPTTAIEVARAQEHLGLLLEAYETAYTVVRAVKQANEPAAFATSRAAAEAMVAALGPRLPSLEVKLEGVPADVRPTMTVDGEPVPSETISLPRRLNPGKHSVVVLAAGYITIARAVAVAEGDHATVEMKLEPVRGAAPAVAAQDSTKTPAVAGAGDASPSPGGSNTWAYAMLGVGAAGVVAGAVTGAVSLASVSSAHCNSQNLCTASGASGDLSTGKAMAWASDVTFAVGIVGLATAGALYFLRPRAESPAPSMHVTTGVGPSGATVGVSGSF